MSSEYFIKKDSSFIFECLNTHLGWEGDFEVIPYLQIIVMDGKNYIDYFKEPCDTIRKYVPILHRYQLKLEDLERMNWTVVYPPKE